MDQKLLNTLTNTLEGEGFDNIKSTNSKHRMGIVGKKGDVNVLIQFSDEVAQPLNNSVITNVPEKKSILKKPNLNQFKIDDISPGNTKVNLSIGGVSKKVSAKH